MDSSGGRRSGLDRSDRPSSKLIAVVIGEPLLPMVQREGLNVITAPLSPFCPAPSLPAALLPVCNTPIIDYVLENLMVNEVKEVNILLNPTSLEATQLHLSQCCTSRGKPWMENDIMKITLTEFSRSISSLADVAVEMREHNVVPQNGSFLLVPIDTVASFTNLGALYQTHLERVTSIEKYAATLLCVSSRAALSTALRDSLASHLAETVMAGAQDPSSPTGNGAAEGVLSIQQTSDLLRLRQYAAPAIPKEYHTMFVLNKATQVVTYMARCEKGEEAPRTPPVVFSSRHQQSVRLDLMPTGYLFCCCEALSLIDFHIRTLYGFLNKSLLDNTEIKGNVFGLIELPPSTEVVGPISSAEAYIECNLDVCSRRLFPMTRESCFAEAVAQYTVSSQCETVYLHTTARCANSGLVGPNVVVGSEVVVPSSAELAGTVVGAGAKIGEEVSLRNCVVMAHASIGRRCVLKGCLIGVRAVIADGVELSNVIVGERCVINGETSCSAGENRYSTSILPTIALFTEDAVASSEPESDEDNEQLAFSNRIESIVEVALQQPSRIESGSFDMSTICLQLHVGYAELCKVVTELLIGHLLTTHRDKSPDDMIEAARDLFHMWCRPFYDNFLSRKGHHGVDAMVATLEGLCGAIGDTNCALNLHGPQLVEMLYYGCDDDLYEERGYCIVSAESLIAFDRKTEDLRRAQHSRSASSESSSDSSTSSSTTDDASSNQYEKDMLMVALSCHAFIMGVKNFLEME